MQQNFEPNDFVYIKEFGYCQLISCGRHKSFKLSRKEGSKDVVVLVPEPVLRKQKESIYFDPESYQFGEDSDLRIVSPPIPERIVQLAPEKVDKIIQLPRIVEREQPRIEKVQRIEQVPRVVQVERILQVERVVDIVPIQEQIIERIVPAYEKIEKIQPVERKASENMIREVERIVEVPLPANLIVLPREPEIVPVSQSVPAPPPSQSLPPPSQTAQTESAPPREVIPVSSEPNIVEVKLYKCASPISIFTPDFNLTKIITVKVKVFVCQHQELQIAIHISSSIPQLKNRIIELLGQPAPNFENPRLFCVDGGQLIEYSNNNGFLYGSKIRNMSKLVFMANMVFGFDPNFRGPDLTLTNSNKTVQRQTPPDEHHPQYQLVLGTNPLYKGNCYFQLKIDKACEDEDIVVGFAKRSVNLKVDPSLGIANEQVWGYVPLAAKKLCANVPEGEGCRDYGIYCKVGDTIGTLISINAKNNMVSQTFFVNGKSLGKSFVEIVEAPVWPALCLNSGHIQVTLNSHAQIPFDAKVQR